MLNRRLVRHFRVPASADNDLQTGTCAVEFTGKSASSLVSHRGAPVSRIKRFSGQATFAINYSAPIWRDIASGRRLNASRAPLTRSVARFSASYQKKSRSRPKAAVEIRTGTPDYAALY